MLNIDQVADRFAAQVTGADISGEFAVQLARDVVLALAQHPVLCFADQPLTDDQQTAFVHQMGAPFEVTYSEVSRREGHNPNAIDVANVEADGSPIAAGSARAKFYDANLLWHADASYAACPVHYSGLSARILPSDPPDTQFADMRAAWDALPDAMQRKCEGMIVEHSIFHSRRKTGMTEEEFTPEFRANFGSSYHHLVRTNPISGRKSLYLASHVGAIVGWDTQEALEFIEDLMAFVTQPQFVYAHKWRPNDFIIWDNSSVMHRGTPYSSPEPRMLRWTGACEREPIAVVFG